MNVKDCGLRVVVSKRGSFIYRQDGELWEQMTVDPIPKASSMSWKKYCESYKGTFLTEEQVEFLLEEEKVNKKIIYPNKEAITIPSDFVVDDTNREEDFRFGGK
ncbi:hypothetical protein ACTXLQ_12690 [Enterococcus hirae]|uniref:hypothetical protein n=1 Tax=Enterococcus hirae TaxID=1354 RepID=UPI003FD304D4